MFSKKLGLWLLWTICSLITYVSWHLVGALGWVSNFGRELIRLTIEYIPVALAVGLIGGFAVTLLNLKVGSVAICAVITTSLSVLTDVYLLSIDAFSWRLALLDSSRWLSHILPLHILVTVVFLMLLALIRWLLTVIKRLRISRRSPN